MFEIKISLLLGKILIISHLFSPDSSLHRAYNGRMLLTNGSGPRNSGDIDTEDTSDTMDSGDSFRFVNIA